MLRKKAFLKSNLVHFDFNNNFLNVTINLLSVKNKVVTPIDDKTKLTYFYVDPRAELARALTPTLNSNLGVDEESQVFLGVLLFSKFNFNTNVPEHPPFYHLIYFTCY